MSEEKVYDNELRGAVWPENNSQVIFRGHIQIGGEKRYCIIVESKNAKGELKQEVFWAAGLITKNIDKVTTQSPDISATIPIPNFETKYKFGGWNKTMRDGREYFSLGLKEKVELDNANEEEAPF